MKKALKGRRFTGIDDIKSASLIELKAILKIEFEMCFKDCHKPVVSNRDYFEGDNIIVKE
jgi:hypothetical protein